MRDGYSQSQAFFEARYQAATDPWQFATSGDELQRYRAIMAALSKPHYQRAYEPGCSVGVLTAALAKRCDQVVACDLSPTAVRRARERCSDAFNAQIEVQDVATYQPGGLFDLIVFSELGYYFRPKRLGELAQRLASFLAPGGERVAVHWLGHSNDHLIHGDAVHATLTEVWGRPTWSWRYPAFRIDAWHAVAPTN